MANSAELPKKLEFYIKGIPKAELHVHIEGTLEPELMFRLAERNGMKVNSTVESVKEKRKNFKDLQDFLDLYYSSCDVLLTEQDFYDLMYAYLQRASVDNVYVTEVFFDPQTHTGRGVSFDIVINGLHRAIVDGYLNFGIKGSIIMCFQRHMTEDDAIATLNQAKPHLEKIIGIGLDSGELGNPPSKFQRVYRMARGLGLKLVAHCGEEGGPSYIEEGLDLLHIQRVDHGVQCLKSDALVHRLVREAIPLTVCPNSNRKLQVNARFFNGRNVTKELLDKGLKVTINSDDPAYFGGYITDNFLATAAEVRLSEKDVWHICQNAFRSTFLPEHEKLFYLRKIDRFNVSMGYATPPKSIAIFGSRKPLPGSAEYESCVRTAKLFASRGFRVVNGGGGGLMEAASKGGKEGTQTCEKSNGEGSVRGVLAPRVFSGRSATGNPFLTEIVYARDISERIQRLIDSSEYFFVCGGTIGTTTELMVAWNAASVRPMYGGIPQRIYLLKSFWEEVMEHLMSRTGVYPQDCDLLTFIENEEEALKLVEDDLRDREAAATL